MDLTYAKGEVRLTVDYRHKQSQLFGLEFTMGDRVVIGSALGSKANTGRSSSSSSPWSMVSVPSSRHALAASAPLFQAW